MNFKFISNFKFQIKNYQRLLLLIILLVVGGGWLLWNQSKPAVAVWFDDNWLYRQIIPITWNGSGASSTQMLITLDTSTSTGIGNKIKSDCSDIRFTDYGGKVLGYFREKCSTSNIKSLFWVDLRAEPTVPAQIYVYYGNAGAGDGSVWIGQPTGIGLGDGVDGACTVSSNISINTGTCVGAANADGINTTVTVDTAQNSTVITVGSTTGIVAGDEILIINQQGTTTDNVNVGSYETARVTSVSGSNLLLNHPLSNHYDGSTQKITVQRVPNYSSVTVNTTITLNATAWNGTKGGIVMFRATGAVTLNGTGVITTTGQGFTGGTAGTLTEIGGNTGESYDGASSGTGGNGSSNGETRGGGRSGDGAVGSNPGGAADGVVSGGGGGGGSDGSADLGGSAGGGGGGGYAGGGGGGGGGGDDSAAAYTDTGGAGGTGGAAAVVGGGGGGGCRDTNGVTNGPGGGNAGSNGTRAAAGCEGRGSGGTAGAAGTMEQGDGGGGAAGTEGSGGGGGGGGYYGNTTLTTLFLGSGGGGGGAGDDGTDGTNGAAGGGIVYISGSSLVMNLTSTIVASGSASTTGGTSAGSGGGGAGGSIYINIATIGVGTQQVAGMGAAGGASGTRITGGGTGGDGRIHFDYSTTTGTTNPTANTAVVPTAGTAATEEKGNGPIVYWKFDEGTGTTLNSSTSSVSATLNALINNPTWQTEDLCVSGKCLYFEGSNATASATTAILGLQSVSFWAKPASSSGTIPFISFSSGTGVTAITSSNLTLSAPGLSSPTYYVNGVNTTTLTANNWNNVVVTTASGFNATNPVLGKVQATYFKGFMDDVKFYNFARTAAQVKADYIGRGTSKGTSASVQPVNDTLNQGLVGYWKMDESSGDAADSSGNGTTLTNNGTTTFVGGKFGNGASMTVNTKYFSTSTVLSNIQTVAFWINPVTNSSQPIDLNGTQTITISSGTITANGFTNSTIYVNGVAGGSLTAGVWQQIVVTSNSFNTGSMTVGKVSSTSVNGTMDEVRLYNRILAPAEIQQLYNFAPGPVAYWNFEEGQGTVVNDLSASASANTANWTGTGATPWVSGKYGKAGNFNGTDDVVTATKAILNAQTVGFWVYPASTTDYFVDLDGGTHYIWANSGTVTTTGFAAPTIYVNGVITSTLVANVWQYVTVTTATPIASGGITLGKTTSNYLNGKLDEVKIYNYARTPGQIVQDLNAGHPLGGSPVGSQADYWKFEEGQGTVANSSGVKGTAGTLTNMASPASVGTSGWLPAGKFGKGVSFDGSNDFVDFGDMSYLESVGTMSASFWVNPNSLAQKKCFLCKFQQTSAASKESFAIETGVTNGNAVMVELSTDGNAATASGETPAGALSVGTWTHVMVVYDSNQVGNANVLKIYINGLQKTLTFSGTIPNTLWATTSNMRAGASSDGTAARLFSGQMDEIKIYSGALSTADVLVDYNHGSGIVLGSFGTSGATTASNSASATYCVPGDTTSCLAPVAEWRFEEHVGTTLKDTSGNGNNGAFSATAPLWQQGKFGQSLKFDGSNTSVEVPTSTALDVGSSTSFTTEAWVKRTGNAASNNELVVFDRSNAWPNVGYHFLLAAPNDCTSNATDTGYVCFAISDGTNSYSITTANQPLTADSIWHHVVAVFDRNTTNMGIYIDGKQQPDVRVGTLANVGAVVNTNALCIGKDISGTTCRGDTLYNFNGNIDELRIYKYARTASQISWNYNRGLPQTWWKFDECSGTTEHDYVGTVSGTITAGTIGDCNTASSAWGDGKTGKNNYSMKFAAATDATKVVSASTYPFSLVSSTNASWGGWFYPSSSINSQALIEKQNQFRLATNSTGNALCSIYNAGAYVDSSSVTAPVTLNAWNHVVCTYDGTNMKTYVNGVLKNTTANATNIAVGVTSLYLGQTAGGANQFTGQADDIKIWNYPLTAYQVQIDMNQGSAVRFGPTTGAP